MLALLDPDPATQINADPCGSGSTTLLITKLWETHDTHQGAGCTAPEERIALHVEHRSGHQLAEESLYGSKCRPKNDFFFKRTISTIKKY
jgi:hypothetical protein